MRNDWFLRSRRRYFLDYHIDDWNDSLLAKYDPREFARACRDGGATAATYMANTHSGLLNWPSKLGGMMHPAFKGRDMLQETIDALHREGLDAIVYYVFGYVVDYWEKHPEARTVLEDGTADKQRVCLIGAKRFATCCFNDSGYRTQALAELAEICDSYDFEGVWPDMTFWPAVCYCENCKKRYRKETGKEIPRIINWKDKEFVRFVNVRKQWLREFCQEVTDTIKSRKPGMLLAQQSQTFTFDWIAGASPELADCYDWMSADLYCDRYGLSFSSKLFYALSRVKPFERVNCWNYPCIHEHVLTRTEDELNMIAYSTIMNDGALTIIDQVDPDGSVHRHSYEVMAKVFRNIERYEGVLGGVFRQDVGIYYSLSSNFDQEWNGRAVREVGRVFEYGKDETFTAGNAHMNLAANAAKTLTMFHVPYGIITKKNLKELSNYKVIVICNAAMMDEEEESAVEAFVRSGGCAYISKETGTILSDGTEVPQSLLSEMIGARVIGRWNEKKTYVSPSNEGKELFPEAFSRKYPVTIDDWQTKIEITDPEVQVLGTVTLPSEYPSEDHYDSLLTTPPGNYTDCPSVIEHVYGQGRVIYSSAALEKGEHRTQREVFFRTVRRLFSDYCTKLEGLPSVEITRFEKGSETVLHVLNHQAELPNIPIYQLEIRAKRYGRLVRRVKEVTTGDELTAQVQGDDLVISLPCLKDYTVIEMEYAAESSNGGLNG